MGFSGCSNNLMVVDDRSDDDAEDDEGDDDANDGVTTT